MRKFKDSGKTIQNELAVRTLARRLVLLGPKTNDLFMLLQMLDDCRHVRSLDCLPYWRPFSLFFLRTWNYELCIKASTPLPICLDRQTLCRVSYCEPTPTVRLRALSGECFSISHTFLRVFIDFLCQDRQTPPRSLLSKWTTACRQEHLAQ